MPASPGDQPQKTGSCKPKDQQGSTHPNTRQETKKTEANMANDNIETIRNARKERAYLEGGLYIQYLCTAGEPITLTALKYCLHQISNMPGIKC